MTSTQDTLDVGDIIVIPGTFTNEAGDPFDPDSVSLKVVSPAGVLSVYVAGVDAQIAHDDLGVFEGRVIATADGWWQARWVLAGSEQSQEPVEYYVRADNTSAAEAARALARRQLVRMTSADTEPLLSDGEINDLLTLAQTQDSLSSLPSDAAWVPTYDLNAAAAEGWRWKAGRAASSYAFVLDGDQGDRSLLHLRCTEMVKEYERKIVVSVPVRGGIAPPGGAAVPPW